MISITKHNLTYSNLIILSTNKKNAQSLAREMNKSGETIRRLLLQQKVDIDSLIFIAKKLFLGRKIYLVIDDTLISKEYSKLIEGTSDNYDSASGSTFRSLCSIVVMLTDGKYAIPIDHAIWTSKEFIDKTEYKTKVELAKSLISNALDKINISVVIMDGLYATIDLISWMSSKKINFEMRFHANRVIIPENSEIKYSIKIKDYLKLIMKDKQKHRTIKAYWKEQSLYFTAVKRVTKKGNELIIFQVSNYLTTPRNHVKIYGFRWNIEKFFRTSKQYLGLCESQSRKKIIQVNHITHVFLSYAILQATRKYHGFKNVERALAHLKKKKLIPSNYLKSLDDQNFGEIYA